MALSEEDVKNAVVIAGLNLKFAAEDGDGGETALRSLRSLSNKALQEGDWHHANFWQIATRIFLARLGRGVDVNQWVP